MEEWKTDAFMDEHGLIFNSLPYEIRVSIQSLKQQAGKLKRITDESLYEERMSVLKMRDDNIVTALTLYLGEDDVTVDDDSEEEIVSASDVSDLIKAQTGNETKPEPTLGKHNIEASPIPAPSPTPTPIPPRVPVPNPAPTPAPEPIVNRITLDENDKVLLSLLGDGRKTATWKVLIALGLDKNLLSSRGGKTRNFELHKGRFDMEYTINPSPEVVSQYLQND